MKPELADRFGKIENVTKRNAIAFDLFGARGAVVNQILNQGSEALLLQLKRANQLQFVTEEQRKISERYISATTLMSDSIGEMGERIVIGLIGPMTEMIELILEWIRKNNEFIRQGLDLFINILVTSFSVLSNALEGLFRLIGNIIKVFDVLPDSVQIATVSILALAVAFTRAGKALLTLLTRLLFIPAIMLSIAVIAEDLTVALLGGDSAIRKMTESSNPLVNAIGSIALAFGEVLGIAGKLIGFLLAGAPGGFNEFINIVSEGLGRVKELFRGEVEIISKFFTDLFDGLPLWARAGLFAVFQVVEAIGDAINSVVSSAMSIISALGKALTGDFEGAWEDIGEGASSFGDALESIFGGAFDAIMNLLSKFSDFFKNMFVGVGDSISDSISGAVDSVLDSLPDFVKTKLGLEIVQDVVDAEIPDISAELPPIDEVDISEQLPNEQDILRHQNTLIEMAVPAASILNEGPTISNSSKNSTTSVSTSINVGGITNKIVVPRGTTEQQQNSISEQVNKKMTDFMNDILLDAQSEVPEMS